MFMPGSFAQRNILLNIHEFEVTCEGYHFSSPHSYSLAIPKGAIKEGDSVKIKTGVTAYGPHGPFMCPKGVTIVSPVIWFMSIPEVHFQKPAVLKIQHCSSDHSCIGVFKGLHDNTSDHYQITKIDVVKDTAKEGHVSFSINHFCIYCLGVFSEEHMAKTQLCIIPIEGRRGQGKEVIFCVTYFLDTCKKVYTACVITSYTHCFTMVYGHELLMYDYVCIMIFSQAVKEQYKDGYCIQSPIVISPNALSIHVQCILEDGSRSRALLKSGLDTVQCI